MNMRELLEFLREAPYADIEFLERRYGEPIQQAGTVFNQLKARVEDDAGNESNFSIISLNTCSCGALVDGDVNKAMGVCIDGHPVCSACARQCLECGRVACVTHSVEVGESKYYCRDHRFLAYQKRAVRFLLGLNNE